jgi:alkylation response protein AidB-like acyl-CoA dehydrogenase
VGAVGSVRIDCPAGKVLLSADAGWIYTYAAITVGRPSANLGVAFAFYDNTGGHANEQVAVTALCAKVAA